MSIEEKIVTADKIGYDQKIYKNNLKALKQCRPDLAKLIEKTPLTNRYGISLYENNIPRLHLRDGDEWKSLSGPFGKNPVTYCEQECFEQMKPYSRTMIFLGHGIGYHLAGFFNHPDKMETSSIIVVERDPEVLKIAIGCVDLIPYFAQKNIHYVVGIDSQELYPLFWNLIMEFQWLMLQARSTSYMIMPSLFSIAKDYYLGAVKAYNQALTQTMVFFGNDPHDALVGIENMILNLKHIADNPGINSCFNKFKSVPAIIAATGPSLKKQLPLLKQVYDQGQAIILAPESSLGPLTSAGIRPHIVTSLERVDNVLKLIEGFDFGDDMFFAAAPIVVPEVYEACKGRKLICYRGYKQFSWLQIDRGLLYIKGSAANMGFNIATTLGCNPIILIGQDLAYGPGGQTHAEGMVLGHHQGIYVPKNRKDLVELPGYYGEEVTSNAIWQLFLNHYKTDIYDSVKQGITVINATEGGAYIEGADHIPFQAAIETHLAKQPHHKIVEILTKAADSAVLTPKDDLLRVASRLELAIAVTDANLEVLMQASDHAQEILLKYKDYVYDKATADDYDAKEIFADYRDLEIKRAATRAMRDEHYVALVLPIIQAPMIRFESQYLNMPDAFDNPREGQINSILTSDSYYDEVIPLVKMVRDTLAAGREQALQDAASYT